MRVKTKQEKGFADLEAIVPSSELDVLEEIIDWSLIRAVLQGIRGDYCPVSMYKMLLLQTWHCLSDDCIADALKRDLVFIRFCGFSLDGSKPDGTTLGRFRSRLVKYDLSNQLLQIVNDSLSAEGLKLSNGKYVSSDATLVQSSRRPKKTIETKDNNVDVTYSDDTDATWTAKGNQSVYGYSSSIITDSDGLVESVTTFTASRSEMTRLGEVLEPANIQRGQVLLYDKGTDSAANRELLKQHGIKDGIMRKKPKGQPMTRWNRLRNKLIGKRRFVVERTFGTMKRTYGLHRARYLGLAKTQAEVLMKSMAYNLKRGMNNYLRKQTEAYCA